MDCEPDILGSSETFWRELRRQAGNQRIPLSGGLDLTWRCNLNCVHCYLGTRRDGGASDPPELETGRVLSILDEITEAGCLFLLLTGGEPLLHPDFAEIYTHARTNGMQVTVFTNGTLVDDSVTELFRTYPPRAVEVSLYGATEDTYERIAGVREAYAQCVAGIERLHAAGIRLTLKTSLMTLNRDDIPAMRAFARGLGLRLRVDPGIIPTLAGDRAPLSVRLPPEEAVRVELAEEERLREWRRALAEAQAQEPRAGHALYLCGAGQRSFYIDAVGLLRPCQMTKHLTHDLKTGDFLTGWNQVMPGLRDLKAPEDFDCAQCESMVFCRYCPSAFELETGGAAVPSPYFCAVGKQRLEAVRTSNRTDTVDGQGEPES